MAALHASGDPVYAEHLHALSSNAWLRPRDMWLLRIDARTGEVSADSGPGDPWSWQHLTGGAEAPDPGDPLLPRARSAALQAAIARRAGRKLDNRAALDRAYGRARIARAGVHLHAPEIPSAYDDFYRLGFPPPTHQEMADHILRSRGRTLRQRAAQALRRLLGIPDAR